MYLYICKLMSTSRASPVVPYTLTLCRPVDGVHSQDLDSCIYYSLWMEVASQAEINGAQLQALQRYINVLARYYAGSDYVKTFLERLDAWLQTQNQPITSNDWRKQLNEMQV